MESQKSKRRAAKSEDTSHGDRRGGSVGERPELARSGGKDSSVAASTKTQKRADPTEAAEA